MSEENKGGARRLTSSSLGVRARALRRPTLGSGVPRPAWREGSAGRAFVSRGGKRPPDTTFRPLPGRPEPGARARLGSRAKRQRPFARVSPAWGRARTRHPRAGGSARVPGLHQGGAAPRSGRWVPGSRRRAREPGSRSLPLSQPAGSLGGDSRAPAPRQLPQAQRLAPGRPQPPVPGGAPSLEQQGRGSSGRPGSSLRRPRGAPSLQPLRGWLPLTAGSQVPRRNFALHMRRPWLVRSRGGGKAAAGQSAGHGVGQLGEVAPDNRPHSHRKETPGLHLLPQSRRPQLGPRASRALPPPARRVARARAETLHPAPPAARRWALEPVSASGHPARPARLPGRDCPSSS